MGADSSRPVVAVTGGGGFGKFLAELTTALKYDMPIKHVLLDNRALGKISKDSLPAGCRSGRPRRLTRTSRSTRACVAPWASRSATLASGTAPWLSCSPRRVGAAARPRRYRADLSARQRRPETRQARGVTAKFRPCSPRTRCSWSGSGRATSAPSTPWCGPGRRPCCGWPGTTHVRTQASAEEDRPGGADRCASRLHRFEGRSALRTWVLRIVASIARRRGVAEVPRDGRARRAGCGADPVPWSQRPLPGGWRAEAAADWGPEPGALAQELRATLTAALTRLPDRRRAVVELRDVHGLAADEVCELLDLSGGNQRVLLHRGWALLRSSLKGVLG